LSQTARLVSHGPEDSVIVESCGTKDPRMHLMSLMDDFTHLMFCRWISAKNASLIVNARHNDPALKCELRYRGEKIVLKAHLTTFATQ
jgi:hypothetical protein